MFRVSMCLVIYITILLVASIAWTLLTLKMEDVLFSRYKKNVYIIYRVANTFILMLITIYVVSKFSGAAIDLLCP